MKAEDMPICSMSITRLFHPLSIVKKYILTCRILVVSGMSMPAPSRQPCSMPCASF